MKSIKKKTVSALRWTEKYTKTDMIYLAKGGSWLTMGHAAIAIFSFITTVILANLLPKETFGSYRFILSVATILAIPTLPGITTAIAQATASGNFGLLKIATKVRLRWGVLSTLGGLILSTYYLINQNTSLALAFLIVAIALPFAESFTTYQGWLLGKKNFSKQTKYTFLSHLAALVVVSITVLSTASVHILLIVYFFVWTFTHIYLHKKATNNARQNTESAAEIVKYGKHLTAMSTLSTIANQIDRLLVFHFLGAVDVAVYILALSIPNHIRGFFRNSSILALPKFTENSVEQTRAGLPNKLMLLSVALLLASLFYILTAPTLFGLFFPNYEDSIYISQLFSLSIIGAITTVITSYFKAKKKTKKLYIFNIASPILQIVLLLILIQPFGLLGAVTAQVVGRILTLGVALVLFRTDR